MIVRTTTPDTPLALRPRDAAKALSISERHLWTLTRDGVIPCVRLGTGKRQTVLYPVPVLQRWLAQQAGASDPPAAERSAT